MKTAGSHSLFIKAYFILCSILLLVIAVGCLQNKEDKEPDPLPAKPGRILADSNRYPLASRDHRLYLLKKELCKKLYLYDLENGTDSFEIRLWREKTADIPMSLNILKWYKGKWTQYAYAFFRVGDQPGKPIQRIDSFTVNIREPRAQDWPAYFAILKPAALWTLPSQCELTGDFPEMPAAAWSLEIADKRKYKFLYYADPASFMQDRDHRLFMDFTRNFTSTP